MSSPGRISAAGSRIAIGACKILVYEGGRLGDHSLSRKILYSRAQPVALAGTLQIMRDRLLRLREDFLSKRTLSEQLLTSDNLDDELLDELLDDQEDETDCADSTDAEADAEKTDIEKLNAEIAELGNYIHWAGSIGVDTKSKALLTALQIGFARMCDMGAARKAVIFTESRRTQLFLKEYLEAHGYADSVVTFDGSNRDDNSARKYVNKKAQLLFF